MVKLKKVSLIFVLMFPMLSFCESKKKDGFFSRIWSNVKKVKNVVPGFGPETAIKKIISVRLFRAYCNKKSCTDRKDIEDILSKCDKSKLDYLKRAFKHGAEKLGRSLKKKKRLEVENAVWDISQDFSKAKRSPKLNKEILKYAFYSIIFAGGCYFGECFKTWSDLSGIVSRVFKVFIP